MEAKPLQYAGDVQTMKCSLDHIQPLNLLAAQSFIDWLQFSREHEEKNQKRITVIKLIDSKVKRLKKQFEIE